MRRSVFLLVSALAVAACKDPAPSVGSLTVNISGLPSGANAFVRITGPESFFRTLNASETLENLVPGEYIVRIDTILHQNTKYGSPVLRDTVQVQAGSQQSAAVTYGISSGSLDLTINGLPAGIPAGVKLTSAGFSTNAISSGIIAGLAPGKYYIQADTFATGQGDLYGSPKTLDSVTVVASTTPATATVTYNLASATLALTVTGLPAGFSQQPITITGPNSYSAKFNATQSIRGLKAGAYTVTAVTANGTCPAIYRTSSTPQNVSLTIGNTGSATVNYAEGTANAADLNLRIEAIHVVQVTQDAAWSVPMIAGRPALVRVFGVANQCNTAAPKIRLTVGTAAPVTITAPESSVRFATDESELTSSWNYTVPGNLVQTGMSIVAEMDFDGAIAETNETDNRYPGTGSRSVLVKNVPTIGIRFVPISQVVNGAVVTGDIAGKTDAFMDWNKRIHPVANFDVNVREPYSTSAGQLGSTGTNWALVLSEIRSLAESDTSANGRRYHYGVARVSYTSGVAGIGYVPGKAALGWDFLPSAASVMAHELGHNYGRSHTPCGGPAQPDPNYPSTGFYSGGRIGVWGYDQISQTLKNPEIYSDIMGYCNTQWISDYTYKGMMDYLGDPNRAPSLSVSGSGAKQPALLIWGRIENGVPILEPAFEIDGYPTAPASAGPNRITAVDASGSEVLSFSFTGNRIADLPGDNETFSFIVPLSQLRGRSVESLKLSARGRTATSVASAVVDADPGVVASRPATGRVRLQWNASRFPVLMVRNRATGNVIAFARGGDATITANQDEVEINASNRVRSARHTVRVLK